MSSLQMADRQSLEAFFGMSSGYVLNFSDSTFGEFVFEKTGIDIDSSCPFDQMAISKGT